MNDIEIRREAVFSLPSYFLSCKHEGIDDSHIYNHLCHGLRLLLITIQIYESYRVTQNIGENILLSTMEYK